MGLITYSTITELGLIIYTDTTVLVFFIGTLQDTTTVYEGFEYQKYSQKYTQKEIIAFETLLKEKLQKMNKKKLLKNKNDEKKLIEKLKKKEIEDEIIRNKLINQQKQEEEKKKAMELKLLYNKKQELIKIYEKKKIFILEHNTKVGIYQEELNNIQKKIKNLKKKQREIIELKEKILVLKQKDSNYKITTEQKQKIDRLDCIEEELQELCECEQNKLASCPGELLVLPVLEDELAALENTITTTSTAAGTSSTTTVNNTTTSSSTSNTNNNNNTTSTTSKLQDSDATIPVNTTAEKVAMLRLVSEEEAVTTNMQSSVHATQSDTTILTAQIRSTDQNNKQNIGSTTMNARNLSVTSVPMNEKGSRNVGVSVSSSASSPSGSHGGDSGDSQYTTPYSFSPLHSGRGSAEPRPAFWGTGTEGDGKGSTTVPARSPWVGSSTAGSSGSTVSDNWRVHRSVPEPVSASRSTVSAQPAWGSSSSTTTGSSSGSSSWGRANTVTSIPPSTTAATNNSNKPAPTTTTAAPPKPSAAPVDEWVTTTTKKKGNKKI